jgi:GNAT superfamily N-acetyltransferase
MSIRQFRPGDGAAIAAAWTAAAPADPVTHQRLVDLVLLDRNFDPAGLFIAVDDSAVDDARDEAAAGGPTVIGAAYAVRRRIAFDGDDLEPTQGWIPFFFVRPDHRGRGIGRELLTAAMAWLKGHGRSRVTFSSYTPNYFLPGLDEDRYPAAARLMASLGFSTDYRAVAMYRSLEGYVMPEAARERIATLRRRGFRFGSPTAEELTEIIEVASAEFNPDWGRAIREATLAGLGQDRILGVWDGDGRALGWAMFGTYEAVTDRFGPFGVLPTERGLGLGEALLHLTLERMRACEAHSAWFLWTDETSPAGRLYAKTGFTVTRTFSIQSAQL